MSAFPPLSKVQQRLRKLVRWCVKVPGTSTPSCFFSRNHKETSAPGCLRSPPEVKRPKTISTSEQLFSSEVPRTFSPRNYFARAKKLLVLRPAKTWGPPPKNSCIFGKYDSLMGQFWGKILFLESNLDPGTLPKRPSPIGGSSWKSACSHRAFVVK